MKTPPDERWTFDEAAEYRDYRARLEAFRADQAKAMPQKAAETTQAPQPALDDETPHT